MMSNTVIHTIHNPLGAVPRGDAPQGVEGKDEIMNTHTPGPWRISGCQMGPKLLIEHGDEETASPVIGSVYTDGGRLPQQANARLIAAAPEMLEALKELREYVDLKLQQHRQDYPEQHAMVQTAMRVIALANKAIANAEGRG